MKPERSTLGKLLLSALEVSAALTLLGGLLVIVRIVTVSRGDAQLAYALFAGADFLSILLSTLIVLAPFVSLGIYLLSVVWLISRAWRLTNSSSDSRPKALRSTLFAGAGAVLAHWVFNVFAPTPFLVVQFVLLLAVSVGTLIVLQFAPRVRKWIEGTGGKRRRPRSRVGEGLIWLSAVLALGFLILIPMSLVDFDTPWAPEEVIYFNSSPPERIRVVGANDGWLVMMRDEPRDVFLIESGDVSVRWTCKDGTVDAYEKTLLHGWRTESVPSSWRVCEDVLATFQRWWDNETVGNTVPKPW